MRVNCMCCTIPLEVEEPCDPMDIYPIYGGLIFRSIGNFGSTIFDPMPTGRREMLQVVICDQCIKEKIKWVTRIYNIKEKTTSESKEFKYDD